MAPRIEAQPGRAVDVLVIGGPLLVAGIIVLAHTRGLVTDAGQIQGSVRAVLDGHLSAAYPRHTTMTSPPGFVLLAAPIFAFSNGVTIWSSAWVSLFSVTMLGCSALRLARTLHPTTPVGGLLALETAVFLGAPTLGAETAFYHPQDLVATGFVLLALADARSGRDGRVGLLLGAAVLTRQWALPLAVLVLVASPGRRRSATVALVLVAAVLAPFVVACPEGLLLALRAPAVVISDYSIWSHVGLPRGDAYALARIGPLVAAIPAGTFLRRSWQHRPPSPTQLVAAVSFLAGLRVLLDVDSLTYYALPLFVPLVVVAVSTRHRRCRSWALVCVLGIEAALAWEPLYWSHALSPTRFAVVLLVSQVGALCVAWRLATGRLPTEASSDAIPRSLETDLQVVAGIPVA